MIRLDYLTRDLLTRLIGQAKAVVFSSRHERFGRPVLEAMGTSTPVITSTTSSLPEVAGSAALLVDPNDVQVLREAVTRLDIDPALGADMRATGLIQVGLLSRERYAERLDDLDRAVGVISSAGMGEAAGGEAVGPTVSAEEQDLLRSLRRRITQPSLGLPDPVFAFTLAVVPMINVDLFVIDGEGRALWAWREDEFGTGWHVPGGIIRAQETAEDRIAATAVTELGATVEAENAPRAIAQIRHERGTFVSLIYRCRLTAALPVMPVDRDARALPGDLAWIVGTPDRVYPAHRFYEKLLSALHNIVPGPLIMA